MSKNFLPGSQNLLQVSNPVPFPTSSHAVYKGQCCSPNPIIISLFNDSVPTYPLLQQRTLLGPFWPAKPDSLLRVSNVLWVARSSSPPPPQFLLCSAALSAAVPSFFSPDQPDSVRAGSSRYSTLTHINTTAANVHNSRPLRNLPTPRGHLVLCNPLGLWRGNGRMDGLV